MFLNYGERKRFLKLHYIDVSDEFNIYFVFGYACSMCICLKTAIWLFCLFWDKVWIFLVKTGWQS